MLVLSNSSIVVKPKNKEEQFVYDYWKKFSWYFEDYDCEEMEELLEEVDVMEITENESEE